MGERHCIPTWQPQQWLQCMVTIWDTSSSLPMVTWSSESTENSQDKKLSLMLPYLHHADSPREDSLKQTVLLVHQQYRVCLMFFIIARNCQSCHCSLGRSFPQHLLCISVVKYNETFILNLLKLACVLSHLCCLGFLQTHCFKTVCFFSSGLWFILVSKCLLALESVNS